MWMVFEKIGIRWYMTDYICLILSRHVVNLDIAMFALVSNWANQQRSSISDLTGGSLKGVTPLRLRPPHQRSSGFDLRGTVFLSDAQCLKHTWGRWFQGDTTAVLQEIFIQTSIQKMWKKQPEGGWLSGFCENLARRVWLSRFLIDFSNACMHTSCAFCSGFNKLQKHMRCKHLQAALNGILLPAVLRRFVSFVLSRGVCCFL